MRKLLSFTLALAAMPLFAQTHSQHLSSQASAQPTSTRTASDDSKVSQFLMTRGTLISRTFYPVANFNRVEVEAFVAKSLTDTTKYKAVRLQYQDSVAAIDVDEAQSASIALARMSDLVDTWSKTPPAAYTEVTFKGHDGFSVGVYYSLKGDGVRGYLDIGRLSDGKVFFGAGDLRSLKADIDDAITALRDK